MSELLAFINNNGVLFSGIFSLLGVIIGCFFKFILESMADKKENIKFLREELEKVQNELKNANTRLEKYTSIEEMEKNIDKSMGSIYSEKLPDGENRDICGYCWEKEHIKIPINVEYIYTSESFRNYWIGHCNSCNSDCKYYEDYDDDYPF